MPRDYTSQSPISFQRRPHLTRGDDWIRDFLKSAKVGHIASSRDDRPFVNPTMFWFDEENQQIVFHSNVVGRVRANADQFSEACFATHEMGELLPSNVALEFSVQYEAVAAFGQLKVLGDDEDRRRALYGLIGKYFGHMRAGREYREITDKELKQTSVYGLQIAEWSGKRNWVDYADQSDEWPPLSAEMLNWFKNGRQGEGVTR